MASFHLDHLKNYHRRFCRPSRAPNIHTKKGQNMLEILQDCFEEQNFTESLTLTPKEKADYSQSLGEECPASHSKPVPVSSKTGEAPLQASAEPREAASGSVQANEVHHGASDESRSSIGSPVVLLGANMSASQKAVSSAGQKRVASVARSPVDKQASNTNISFKTRKRLNFEDKVISNTAEIENSALPVEDNISEGQEGTSSEITQKRDDLSFEVQSRSKKSFSELYLETVKRKNKSSSVVRHTAAVPSSPPPLNDIKLLEDEFIIDGSDRSFSSRPWVLIPKKDRHLSPHKPSPENIALLQGKKSREKPQSLSATTFVSNTQSDKAHPVEEAQLSVDENLGTTWTDELENDCRSTENKMHSKTAKKPPARKRTTKRKQRRVSKPKEAEELSVGQSNRENSSVSNTGQDKLQINSKRNMRDCEEVRNEPSPKKHKAALENKKKTNSTQTNKGKSGKKCFSGGSKNKFVPEEVTVASRRERRVSQHPSDWWIVKPDESSVDGNSSKENDSSVVYPNKKKQTKRNHVSKNTGKKSCPSKRQKTEISSRVQKSLNVKGSGGTVSGHDDISSSQRKPLKSIEADPTQKSLDISGPKRGCKYQNNVMISPNVHLKSHTEEYTSKTQMESASNSEVSKRSVWEESGPSRLKNYEMPGSSNSVLDNEKDQKSLHLKTRSSNMVPDKKLHHKLVLPSSSPGVRRSNRIRLKPLEYWRGERIDYQESSSGRLVVEIVSPASASTKIKAKRNLGKVNKKVTKKQFQLDSCERTKMKLTRDVPLGDPFQATLVKDPETRELVPMDLIRPRDTYHFFVEQHGLKVFKTLDTTFFSTGKLVLGPYEEKGKQHVGQDILVFYVYFGDLLCTLHETPYNITTGDSFYVPSGNHYNIKNLLNVESSLLFTQIKR
ncbi:centromere protein C [Mus pahari]|uniref:centromere protein C n=1 Tax=Mus pahari TaxID=10093 RepID=UPI000FC6B80B|nr:centromere protein C [Mus pahari]XP_029401266.1 centromere protein C [Mus pahari]XP_029401267.1 centromere protein C [Mus pahari]